MYSLKSSQDRYAIALRMKQEIDDYACIQYGGDGTRRHLGASEIGKDCLREVWYGFRHAIKGRPTNGRMQRLFQRGHLEEARFIEYLLALGWKVSDRVDGGEQHRCSALGGHFGGSLDSLLLPPPSYAIAEQVMLLGEYKTKSTGSGFVALMRDGIKVTNYQHYVQMCIYGYFYKLPYAVYFSVNKNDDDLHIEIVELDVEVAEKYLGRAHTVINGKVAPPRISNLPTYFKCKVCTYEGICHRGEKPSQSCRSCIFATPVTDGRWHCDGYKALIPDEVKTDEQGNRIAPVIERGCSNWSPIS